MEMLVVASETVTPGPGASLSATLRGTRLVYPGEGQG